MIRPSSTTTVSAPMKKRPAAFTDTAWAFSRDRRMTCSSGFSPGSTSSQMSAGITTQGIPARAISSERRGEADASTMIALDGILFCFLCVVSSFLAVKIILAGFLFGLHFFPVLLPVFLANLQEQEYPRHDDHSPE